MSISAAAMLIKQNFTILWRIQLRLEFSKNKASWPGKAGPASAFLLKILCIQMLTLFGIKKSDTTLNIFPDNSSHGNCPPDNWSTKNKFRWLVPHISSPGFPFLSDLTNLFTILPQPGPDPIKIFLAWIYATLEFDYSHGLKMVMLFLSATENAQILV